tara:strand:+ start:323 stop:1000 length:678 start_codon:yes stop_codon:yes gene_type:complete
MINNFYDPYFISVQSKNLIKKYKIKYLLYTIVNLIGNSLTIKNTNVILYNDKDKIDILIFTDNITLIIKKILPILDEIQNVISKKIGKQIDFIKKGLKVKKDVITLCCNHKKKCFLNGYELFLCFDKIIILYIKIVESFINVKPIVNNYNDNVKLLNVKGIYLFMNMYYSHIYHITNKLVQNNIKKFKNENNLRISFALLVNLHKKVFNCTGNLVDFNGIKRYKD